MRSIATARGGEIVKRGVTKHLQRPVSETILDHVVITTSGFFTLSPFLAALLTFGADRILFSVDYPFRKDTVGRKFWMNCR